MLIRVLDFETLGLTPADGGVVEAGWCDVWVPDEGIDPSDSVLVNPGRPIPPEASAIHHIVNAMVRDAPVWDSVLPTINADVDVFCAHNANFERAWFDGGDRSWICSMKVARRLWPDCPSHSNQCLRYWLGLDLDPALAMPPHRAGPDAFVTAHILRRALDEANVAEMIEWTKQPSLLPRVNFGKHRDKGWHEVPDDYLEWILKQKDMDEDVVHTAKHHLKSRVW